MQGLAGTGKTYMLNATREVLEKNGYEVIGASFTGKAAEGLQTDAKIKSTTIHSLLNKLEKEAGNSILGEDFSHKIKWDFEGLTASQKPEVWVIDEAGLTDNNIMVNLQEAAKLKKAKVVLVGDYQQLAPVGAGNSYSNLVQSGEISTCYLSDIRRQKDETLLKAVYESVKGDINKSLELMSDRIFEIKSPVKRIKAITKEYTLLSTSEQEKTIVLTAKNKDRIAINDSIRKTLIKKGKLEQGKEYTIQTGKANECKRNFAVNDKIIFFKNDYKLGVMNGQTGNVIEINDKSLIINSNDKNIEINLENYNHFDHGYAMTTHKAQGITANKVIINMDSSQKQLNSRNNYYVDISRAKNEVSIYTNSKCKIDQQVSLFARKLSLNNFKRKDDSLKVKISRKIDYENKLYLSIKNLARKIDDVNKIKIKYNK